MESKLPLDTLGKIWDLADMDKDGMLDRHEFLVAMHLVYKALEKHTIPNTLPPELAAKRKLASPVGGAPILTRGLDGIKPEVPPMPVTQQPMPVTQQPMSIQQQPMTVQQQPMSVPQQPMPLPQQPMPVPKQPMPVTQTMPVAPPQPVIKWVVSMDDKAKYDIQFTQADIDKDGYVSGLEIKDVFLKSGVPQHVLAHIW